MGKIVNFPPNIVAVAGYADDEQTIPVCYVHRVPGGYAAVTYDPDASDGELNLGTFATIRQALNILSDWDHADWVDIIQHGTVRH